MATIGLSNVQIRSAEGNFVPVCTVGEIKASVECDPPKWWQDITKPISISSTIRAKRNGTIFEKCLYYQKSKKKRIRKKWNIKSIIFNGFRRCK